MPHALVEQYVDERDRLLNTVNVLKNNAADTGKDPTDTDLEVMDKAFKRIDRLDEMIKVLGEDRTMSQETRDKLMAPTPDAPAGSIKYRSAGEMVWDCLHANYGSQQSHDDQDATRRWDGVMKRAAQHMGDTAAGTTPVAGGIGGLYVVPVVGPVIALFPQGQPFISAIGRKPAPSSLTFTRPRIVDPNFKTGGVGVQALEKTELVSTKFDIAVDTLALSTIGGYLNVSQQLMSLHPTGWDLIVNQLQQRLAYGEEVAALTEVAKTTDKVTLAATADAPSTLAALFTAASHVFANTQQLPSWIAYGPVGWAQLGKLTDGAGRPLFPFLGANNAMGTSSLGDFNLGPLGLQQVVTPGITDNTIYMGNDFALEAYFYSFPILEAIEPALMGRQVAVAEAVCFYRPTTAEGAPALQNGAVKIAP